MYSFTSNMVLVRFFFEQILSLLGVLFDVHCLLVNGE